MKENRSSLDRLALLAQGRPNLLAGPLALYKEQEGLDDEQLARILRCEVGALPRLALCERPRPAPHFREDVKRIAGYIQADVMQLAMLIRAAESREALRSGANAVSPGLLAARDNEEDEELLRGDEDDSGLVILSGSEGSLADEEFLRGDEDDSEG